MMEFENSKFELVNIFNLVVSVAAEKPLRTTST
jgi:hypothetical protein